MKKGDKTKQFIISESKKLFSERGYATVTMKDICEICDLSRGGLYRYFGSTKEIFLEILNEDKEDKSGTLLEYISKGESAMQILAWFFQDRKETLMLGNYKGFSFAIHEFSKQETEQKEYLKERLNQAEFGLATLLEYGQKQGEFREFDIETMSLSLLLFLDSLETNAYILDFTDQEVEAQLKFLLGMVKLKNTSGQFSPK